MKADQHKQIEFIKDLLRESGKRGEILAKFVKVWQNASTRTFDRRLKEAEKALQIEFKAIEQKTEESIAKEVEVRKTKILTAFERQEILTKIASGELEREEIFFDKGQPKKIKVKPNFSDISKAIAELNKMQGDYAPQKLDHTTKGNEIRQFNIITPKPDDSQ